LRQQEERQEAQHTRESRMQSLLETQTSFIKLWDTRIRVENNVPIETLPNAEQCALPQS